MYILQAAKDEIQECIESNFNFTQIQEELAESRKTGAMEEVFAKYCAKTPIIQNCIKNLTLAVEPCLEEEEKESLTLILNITESLGNFGCYKEGDRIASKYFLQYIYYRHFSLIKLIDIVGDDC